MLRNAACVQAQGYLRQKVANHAHERQLCAILLALNLPPKNVASDVTRCYALRWAIVEEADAYFVYRQYQCRVCLRKQTGKELWYDNGFGSMPVCKLCHLNQSCPDDLAHTISCMLPCCDVNQAPLLQCAAMPGAPARTITYRAAIPNEHQCTFIQSHCLLCGLGANTTEHWLTACVVTKASLFIVLVTLGYAGTASFSQQALHDLTLVGERSPTLALYPEGEWVRVPTTRSPVFSGAALGERVKCFVGKAGQDPTSM